MPHILPTSANETVGEEIGDYCPVFYNASAQSAQSAETHSDHKTQFVVYKHELSCCSLFYYLWLEAGGHFSLDSFNFCVYGQTDIV